MRCAYGYDAQVADWVAQRIPHMGRGEDFGPCAAIGVVDENDVILGGVVFHSYRRAYGDIELSFASQASAEVRDRMRSSGTRAVSSRRWLTQPIIRELLSYPFVQLQCQRVTGVTPRRATSARRFLDHFGFKREGNVRRGFGDDDAIISGLLREEWLASRWAKSLPERKGIGRADDRQADTSSPGGA